MSIAKLRQRLDKVSKEKQEAQNLLSRLSEEKRGRLIAGKDVRVISDKIKEAKAKVEDLTMLEAELNKKLAEATAKEHEREIAEKKRRLVEAAEEIINHQQKVKKQLDHYHTEICEELSAMRVLREEIMVTKSMLNLNIPILPNMASPDISLDIQKLIQSRFSFLNFDFKHWLDREVKPKLGI